MRGVISLALSCLLLLTMALGMPISGVDGQGASPVADRLAGSVFVLDSQAKRLYGIDGMAALAAGDAKDAIVMVTALPHADG